MKTAGVGPRARFGTVRRGVRWIAQDNPAAAQGLLDAFLKAAELIGEYPQAGRTRADLTTADRYRFVRRTGYPYLIVYVADRDPPLILRMVHGSRDPPSLLRDLR